MYRCEATSIEGFIQQLAVAYVGRGYWFYVAGAVPPGKDPKAVDAKLIEKYGIDISKWTRARRKRLGLANLQYIRFERFFVLIASSGEHPFFQEESGIRDIRRSPIRFAGYSVSFRKGRDEQWHPSVRIDVVEFKVLKREFERMAINTRLEVLGARISNLNFSSFAPIHNQYRELLRAINKRRTLASLDMLPKELLPSRRRVVRPFE